MKTIKENWLKTFKKKDLKKYSKCVNKLMRIKLVLCFFLITLISFGQTNINDKTEMKFICFTPKFKKNTIVNGLAIGGGLTFINEGTISKVNGLNIELNPLSPLALLMADPELGGLPSESKLIHNGIHFSTGNFSQNTLNGISISGFNKSYETNGLTIAGMYNFTTVLRGVHVSGICNISEISSGIFISAINKSDDFSGLELGVYNKSESCQGIQIGLLNKSKQLKGLQIGLWNINQKRSLPFINF
jgi:hypothetical protein